MVNKKATALGMDSEVYNEIYTYIQAMINLYGVIHREKVIEIINKQNDYQINLNDLRLIEEDERTRNIETYIGIKDEYFVSALIMAFENFDAVMRQKAGKPYYIPEKEELLKYAHLEHFEVNEQFEAVRRFFRKRFWRKSRADELALEIQRYCKPADSLANIGYLFENRELKIKNEKDVNELMGLIRELANNTRVPENNGFTPNEMEEIRRNK
ncbi:hypothetical protein [Clostridiisalibacter paucivorans]|uniref:hypothetical protein n=1 Tax=Clostridiisalibacter paucivorans TaxID=408753 RepID=UPI00047A0C39|nr:hypothetical protein [Clostridiisalibacter paucivorans]